MGIIDLFSKRQKRQRGEYPDVYQYDVLPSPFRTQVVHILLDALGDPNSDQCAQVYQSIHKVLSREYGTFALSRETIYNMQDYMKDILAFFQETKDIEKALDVIELCFKMIEHMADDQSYHYYASVRMAAKDAIDELNTRFREHAIGFAYENGQVMRVDSQVIHSEIVKPALALLADASYVGANEEFMSAHRHYREGRYKEAIIDALKALESVLKVICRKRKWTYDETGTAKQLLDVCFANGLVPAYLSSHYTSLRAVLESGPPTIRNKVAGHGQGAELNAVPVYLAAYEIHLVAASIQFLIHAEKALS